MEITIMTKNFASNIGVEPLVRRELARVQEMFNENTIFDACIKKEKTKSDRDVYKCDVTVKNGRQFVRGYGEGDTVDAAVDAAVDGLKRKARKIKTMSLKKRKAFDKFLSPSYQKEPTDESTPEFNITRVKHLYLDVMTVEEAALQMELSGHNMFLFFDEHGSVNVVYKKEDGYGLLVVQS